MASYETSLLFVAKATYAIPTEMIAAKTSEFTYGPLNAPGCLTLKLASDLTDSTFSPER